MERDRDVWKVRRAREDAEGARGHPARRQTGQDDDEEQADWAGSLRLPKCGRSDGEAADECEGGKPPADRLWRDAERVRVERVGDADRGEDGRTGEPCSEDDPSAASHAFIVPPAAGRRNGFPSNVGGSQRLWHISATNAFAASPICLNH